MSSYQPFLPLSRDSLSDPERFDESNPNHDDPFKSHQRYAPGVSPKMMLHKMPLVRIVGVVVLLFLGIAAIIQGSSIKERMSSASKTDGLESILGPSTDKEEGFTLIAPTYKRAESLPEFLNNYASGEIPSLRRVVLLWNEVETSPPANLSDSLAQYKVPVIIEERHINSLNQRFRPTKYATTECIFAIDDDMIFEPRDIEMGFQAWKEFGQGRKRMVGYIARDASETHTYIWAGMKAYSMILTKAAFFHSDWMQAYWSPDSQMASLRDYVEEHDNCEDILLSHLVARHTRLPPLLVQAPFKDGGLKNGISTKHGHYEARSACVKHFAEVMGNDTLIKNNVKVMRYG